MRLKNGKTLYNERGITFFHETERYVNNLNRSKNETSLWDDLIESNILQTLLIQVTVARQNNLLIIINENWSLIVYQIKKEKKEDWDSSIEFSYFFKYGI